MIGLIGPRDSVRAIQDVATRTDFAGELVPRPYEDAAQTSALARELSHFCQVILCTGRAPYALIADDPDVSSEVQYISHSGADLYHSIAQALIEDGGTVPKVSVDTMEATDTIFAFTELGLPEPELVELSADGSGLDALAAQHRALLADGTVQAVMTCVSQVYADLAADDVRVWRISHTRPTLAEALSRAHLADQLVRSRSLELGVVLFEIDEAELRKLSSFERENTRLTVHQHLLKLAHKHSGRLNNLDERSFLMTVTRGVIEEAIQRAKDNQRSLLTEFGGEVRIHIGAGTGTSYSFAEANARQALEFTKQQSTPHVVFPGGQVVAATAQDDPGFQLQNTSGPVLDLASRLGIGPLSARRLMNALGRLGHEPITAQQLAHAYGVQARSARRLLASLCEAGLAAEVGLRAHPGAGRPQTVYEVDLSQIMVETD
ncbi:hypothetical protein [Microlunatus sp. Y2014]|uniref:hypothetical protein n=1 Tax=Microlunatus sp. Y2014 TaxID=3418488 RepID=UPI003DA6F42F